MIGPYEENTIVEGDALELAKSIPDDSIDIIITDPLYAKKYLYHYEFVAQESPRVMKPGAYAFIYGGWLCKEIYDILCSGDWDYFMTMGIVNKGAYPRWWSKQLMIGFKPVYVFTKGKPSILKWQSNLYISPEPDKKFHKYGQGIQFPIQKIEMFTQPGDLVLDYFCGGGQIPAAAAFTDRKFLAFEIDPKHINTARTRLLPLLSKKI